MIVDDHPIVREGIRRFINMQEDLDLCCEAGSIEEALLTVVSCAPQLVIVDISFKKDFGLDLVKTFRCMYPEMGLLVMSQHDETVFAERALRAGANGYLMKSEATGKLLLAVRKVLAGQIYLSDVLQSRILQQAVAGLRSGGSSKRVGNLQGLVSSLTEREFEVLHLLGLGFGTRQTAEKLNRSIKTIETHKANLKEKLQLESGAEVARFAHEWVKDM